MVVPDDAVERLRSHLAEFGVSEKSALRSLLADAWDAFDGSDESAMSGLDAACRHVQDGTSTSVIWCPSSARFTSSSASEFSPRPFQMYSTFPILDATRCASSRRAPRCAAFTFHLPDI